MMVLEFSTGEGFEQSSINDREPWRVLLVLALGVGVAETRGWWRKRWRPSRRWRGCGHGEGACDTGGWRGKKGDEKERWGWRWSWVVLR